jgi:putative phosphonate metabolism protein
MTAGSGRYAIYFAPEPGSELARLGAAWLGYDAAAGRSVPQPVVAALLPERLHAITEEPRRYGFHATLKPPFVLAEGMDAAALGEAVSTLAQELPPFAAPRLRVACLSGFWALMLAEPCPAMDDLAAVCVGELDRFRAPPSAAEVARRRNTGLSPAQEALLARWGYPYVMAEFRFHMTLTSRLEAEEAAIIGRTLPPLVAPACERPLEIAAISLFRQERHDAPFHLVRRYRLTG